MNTHLTRELGDGCRYEVAASGAYRTRDVTGESLRSPLRDVDITAQTTLTCRGQLVRRDQHHLVFPRMASAEELLTLLHERFATRVPNSSCTWAPVFDVNGGVLEAQSLVSSCSPAQEHAALIPYGTRPFAIGGGPRMINGRITNPYLDRTQPLPLEPIAPPYPPLDYGTPRAAPGNTNK
jgi:hypothetical protein